MITIVHPKFLFKFRSSFFTVLLNFGGSYFVEYLSVAAGDNQTI